MERREVQNGSIEGDRKFRIGSKVKKVLRKEVEDEMGLVSLHGEKTEEIKSHK